ncbi:hypothetical protein [Rhizosphaericola mali]|uniref:hypothetical protein n=1 Tax=Rhizosphaericola mali TaxID=2545455 RepID=UPI001CD9CEE4|nr:hypothetical protein [Rhizosphaericola mali]
MNTTTDKLILESEYLSRPNTILIFKPNNYDKTIKYPLVYLLNGYSEDFYNGHK